MPLMVRWSVRQFDVDKYPAKIWIRICSGIDELTTIPGHTEKSSHDIEEHIIPVIHLKI